MIAIRRIVHDDKAVSETLGYILLFGIALTAIAIILLVGNTIISNEKSKDNFLNMVQSFDIIQSNMKQVALDGTPVKTTVLRMDGGSIALTNETSRLQIQYGAFNYDHPTGRIMFTKENDATTNVSFENGGIWRSSSGYSTIVSPPRIYITPETNTMVLNVFRLNPPNSSIGNAGTGSMTIEMAYNNKSNVLPPVEVPGGTVTLTLDTNYTQAWKDYLSDSVFGTDVTVSYNTYPDGVKATFSGVDKLIVSEHWVDVDFSGLYG